MREPARGRVGAGGRAPRRAGGLGRAARRPTAWWTSPAPRSFPGSWTPTCTSPAPASRRRGLDLSAARVAPRPCSAPCGEASAARGGGRLIGQGWDESRVERALAAHARRARRGLAGAARSWSAPTATSRLGNTAALKESGRAGPRRGGARRRRPAHRADRGRRERGRCSGGTSTSLSDAEIEEAQLQGAALAAARGRDVRARDVDPGQARPPRVRGPDGARSTACPPTSAVYFGEIDIPYATDFGVHAPGRRPVPGRLARGADRRAQPSPTPTARGPASSTTRTTSWRSRSTTRTWPGCRSACTRSGTRRSTRPSRVWERVYRALDSRLRRHFRARRHRIEHFEAPRPDQIERAAALGLAISVQPRVRRGRGAARAACTRSGWGGPRGEHEPVPGPARPRTGGRARAPTPRSPRWTPCCTVWALEHHHDPGQRLTRAEAIRLCTIGAARLAHLDAKKGRLHPGAHADLAVYEADPYEVGRRPGAAPGPHRVPGPRGVRPMTAKKLDLDQGLVEEARELARRIAKPVDAMCRAHTTVAIERATLRLLGLDGAVGEGVDSPAVPEPGGRRGPRSGRAGAGGGPAGVRRDGPRGADDPRDRRGRRRRRLELRVPADARPPRRRRCGPRRPRPTRRSWPRRREREERSGGWATPRSRGST